jgi:hypothetical protein
VRKGIKVYLERGALLVLGVLLVPVAFLATLGLLVLTGALDRLARRVPPDRLGRPGHQVPRDQPEPPERPATTGPPGRQAHQAYPDLKGLPDHLAARVQRVR